MKHTVATCAHLLAALQWKLVDAELNADAELKVAHDRQAYGSRPRQEARGRRIGPIHKRTDALTVSLSKQERQERENKHHNNNTENNHHQQLQRETTKLQLP